MLFQWMYSTSINVWKQHSLNLDAFALRHGVLCRRLSVPSRRSLSFPTAQPSEPAHECEGCWFPFCSYEGFVHSAVADLSHTFCVQNTGLVLSVINAITSSHVLSVNRNADCLFKRKNGRMDAVHRCVCMFAATYVPRYFGCFSLIKL